MLVHVEYLITYMYENKCYDELHTCMMNDIPVWRITYMYNNKCYDELYTCMIKYIIVWQQVHDELHTCMITSDMMSYIPVWQQMVWWATYLYENQSDGNSYNYR